MVTMLEFKAWRPQNISVYRDHAAIQSCCLAQLTAMGIKIKLPKQLYNLYMLSRRPRRLFGQVS